jgi:hypothetical protein
MLVRALGLIGEAGGRPFTDVQPADWFAQEAAVAAQYGLITGYADGTFRPHRSISREEMAVMAARALAFVGYDAARGNGKHALLAPFRDADAIAAWAEDDVAAVIHANIMNGRPGDRFMPKQNATRAEAAAILARMLRTVGFING